MVVMTNTTIPLGAGHLFGYVLLAGFGKIGLLRIFMPCGIVLAEVLTTCESGAVGGNLVP